jgi:hypothetical protein
MESDIDSIEGIYSSVFEEEYCLLISLDYLLKKFINRLGTDIVIDAMESLVIDLQSR